ncbi:hypothetical protein [Xylocopilactobacillus apicola]|uniref:Uncharacterized protein n=1 Tax=Xylocopilactobacillus apicola TaxID=2932184 RepID=A0AAU9DV58_9LACO|nr:hypothetical protein [Xylocopilactobacillus apicola]BDR59378.1 hypothetical protein XA3_18190 [Xylocopilactobacillus apicola]
MIEIKYKIFDSFNAGNNEFKGEYGYFLIVIDDETYGYYREDVDLDILSTNIYNWFVNLLKGLSLLESNKTVYISDVETPETWIRLAQNTENIQIGEINAEKPDGTLAIETDIDAKEATVWTRIIKAKYFREELFVKVNKYLKDLEILNGRDNDKIKELKFLLSKLSEV